MVVGSCGSIDWAKSCADGCHSAEWLVSDLLILTIWRESLFLIPSISFNVERSTIDITLWLSQPNFIRLLTLVFFLSDKIGKIKWARSYHLSFPSWVQTYLPGWVLGAAKNLMGHLTISQRDSLFSLSTAYGERRYLYIIWGSVTHILYLQHRIYQKEG